MKLISCHIDAFGKFKNVDFVFDEKMQVICEKNGFGKTTLAQFIKAMFYSLPPTSKRANFRSERDLYKPFDYDGRFGGSLTFSCKKGDFIVARQFGSTPTLDKFYLFNAKTNLTSNVFSSNLGEELFGVGKETFENSTFFEQQNLESGINDDMRATLATGVLSGDDVDNFDHAQTLLQKKMKEIRADARALKVEESEEDYKRAKATEEVLKIKIANVDEDLKNATLMQTDLERSQKHSSNQNANVYINQNVALGSVIDADKVRVAEKMQQKENLTRDVLLSAEEYRFLKNDKNAHRGHLAKDAMYACLLVAILGFIGIACGGIMRMSIILILSAVVTILGIVGFVVGLFVSRSCADEMKKYADILKKHSMSTKTIKIEMEKFEKVASDVNFLEEEIAKLNLEIEKKSAEKSVIERQFFDIFGCRIENFYLQTNEKSQRMSSIEKRIVELQTDKKHFTSELENIQDKIFELSDSLSSKKEELVESQKKLDVLLKTSQILENARDSISNRYIEPVSDRFNKYYKKFVANGENVMIDSNLDLRFGRNFSDVEFLSAGLFDLVYICKRFALVDLLYKKEKPAIILDDPFANFDDEKLDIAKKLLKEMCEDYQIILFTCQKSRA